MTEWTMNTAQLEKGMFIRRPSLDESLEVLNVRNGQAKIKLPDGKTSTIPASAEVEWSWPEMNADKVLAGNTREKFVEANPEIANMTTTENETESGNEWQTDWSLLDVGIKIEVLGEAGDFTILRLSDSSARIKHNATGKIEPMSIGHKFKIVDSVDAGGKDKAKDSKAAKTEKADKSDKAPKSRKPRSDKGSKVAHVEPPEVAIDNETDTEPDSDDTAPTLFDTDNEPSDEDLTAIENGDDTDTDTDTGADGYDMIGDDLDTDDLDQESIEPFDNDDFKEDDDMPAPAPKPAKAPRSASTSLLTVGQIADRTGISYPTLMRYIRDHADRLPSEGEGRSRRFLPEAIEVFKQIRSETKGGRPGKGSTKPANPSNPPRKMPSKPVISKPRVERSHETAAPYAAPARSQAKPNSTAPVLTTTSPSVDQALARAIESAEAQISGLQSLIDNLRAQREALLLWS